MANDTPGTVVTFYSWKGGVGRTMALANIGVQLARRGARVLMVDWDLEAPGLDHYFLNSNQKNETGLSIRNADDPSGLGGMLCDASKVANGSVERKAWESRLRRISYPVAAASHSIPNPPTTGSLALLPSGYGSTSYCAHISEFSWTAFYGDQKGGSWLENLRKQWASAFDFVLIDSRTGLTDSGGVCTVQMPDILVFVFTANEQSLEDGLRFIKSAQEQRTSFAFDRPPLVVIPLLSRWEGEAEVDLGAMWMERLDSCLKSMVSSWLPKAFSPKQFVEKTRIPHVPRFSFGEPLPVLTHSITDVILPGYFYDSFARLLITRLADAGKIIDPAYEPSGFTAGFTKAEDLQLLSLLNEPLRFQQALARYEISVGQDSAELANFIFDAGNMLTTLGRYNEAEPLIRRALAHWQKNPDSNQDQITTCLNNLGLLLEETNRMEEAELVLKQALAIKQERLHPDDPAIATALNNLAQVLESMKRHDEAELMMRKALEIDEKSYGQDHVEVATDLSNLALLLKATNRSAEAETMIRRALDIDERSLGIDHPKVAVDLNNLALALDDTRATESEALLRRALLIDQKTFGTRHPKIATRLGNIAHLLLKTNRYAEAETLLRQSLEIDELSFGSLHPKVISKLGSLVVVLEKLGRTTEAEVLRKRILAMPISEKKTDPDMSRSNRIESGIEGGQEVIRKASRTNS